MIQHDTKIAIGGQHMEIWYTEQHTPSVRFSIRVDKTLYTEQTEFQRIDIFESDEFGRCLTLDGLMMVTEKDEFIYHDMIVHVPMAANPRISRVLVIGGGDGGTIRELVRYPNVTHVDLVEIDTKVVSVCQAYFPSLAGGFSDPRVRIHIEDGLRYIRSHENEYDLIIVDSTDPFGPGEGLFTKEFYGNCYKALTEDGILVNQHECPYYPKYAHAMQRAHKRIQSFFPICKVYQAHIPTYPSGHWLFGFASKRIDPVADLDAAAWNTRNLATRYYNTDLHVGSFALPNYVRDLLTY